MVLKFIFHLDCCSKINNFDRHKFFDILFCNWVQKYYVIHFDISVNNIQGM